MFWHVILSHPPPSHSGRGAPLPTPRPPLTSPVSSTAFRLIPSGVPHRDRRCLVRRWRGGETRPTGRGGRRPQHQEGTGGQVKFAWRSRETAFTSALLGSTATSRRFRNERKAVPHHLPQLKAFFFFLNNILFLCSTLNCRKKKKKKLSYILKSCFIQDYVQRLNSPGTVTIRILTEQTKVDVLSFPFISVVRQTVPEQLWWNGFKVLHVTCFCLGIWGKVKRKIQPPKKGAEKDLKWKESWDERNSRFTVWLVHAVDRGHLCTVYFPVFLFVLNVGTTPSLWGVEGGGQLLMYRLLTCWEFNPEEVQTNTLFLAQVGHQAGWFVCVCHILYQKKAVFKSYVVFI